MGEVLDARRRAAFGQNPQVGDIPGRGLFRALDFAADRGTKTPFDAARRIAARLKSAAMEEGLIIHPAGGTVDGRRGDRILIAPPFIIEHTDVNGLVARSPGRWTERLPHPDRAPASLYSVRGPA